MYDIVGFFILDAMLPHEASWRCHSLQLKNQNFICIALFKTNRFGELQNVQQEQLLNKWTIQI